MSVRRCSYFSHSCLSHMRHDIISTPVDPATQPATARRPRARPRALLHLGGQRMSCPAVLPQISCDRDPQTTWVLESCHTPSSSGSRSQHHGHFQTDTSMEDTYPCKKVLKAAEFQTGALQEQRGALQHRKSVCRCPQALKLETSGRLSQFCDVT